MEGKIIMQDQFCGQVVDRVNCLKGKERGHRCNGPAACWALIQGTKKGMCTLKYMDHNHTSILDIRSPLVLLFPSTICSAIFTSRKQWIECWGKWNTRQDVHSQTEISSSYGNHDVDWYLNHSCLDFSNIKLLKFKRFIIFWLRFNFQRVEIKTGRKSWLFNDEYK